jgi:hypothetical protein
MRSGFYKLRSHLRMLTPPYLNGIALRMIFCSIPSRMECSDKHIEEYWLQRQQRGSYKFIVAWSQKTILLTQMYGTITNIPVGE